MNSHAEAWVPVRYGAVSRAIMLSLRTAGVPAADESPAAAGASAARSPTQDNPSSTLTMSSDRFMPRNLSGALPRRDFVLGMTGAAAALLTRAGDAWTQAPRVDAVPTIFYAPPDARRTLVRFIVQGTDAPAGRLRVFDQARRQVATAGVIGLGDRLYGELWLPLERDTTYYSDLELPRTRGVIRSTHRLLPRPRWTLRWITLPRPLSLDGAEYLDHATFLHLLGGEAGPVLLEPTGTGAALSTLPLLLAGSGTRWLVRRDVTDGAASQLRGRDGSSVTIMPVAPGGTPDELGLFTGGDDMTRRVERYIEIVAGTVAAGPGRTDAVVVGADPGDFARAAPHLEWWSQRYAFPHISSDSWADVAPPVPAGAALAAPIRPAARAIPDDAARARMATARAAERTARVERLITPLVSRLSGDATGLAAVAAQFAYRTPTTLVFNPSPFTRSDIAVMPDGTERVVLDVPGTGFLCVPTDPGQPRAAWTAGGDELVLRNSFLTVRVDPGTGALRSARGPAEREWIQSRGPGWNALDGLRLDDATPERNPHVGERLTLQRSGPGGVRLRTTLTLYRSTPWLDIRNELSGSTAAPAYQFPIALDQPRVSWEIPAGFETSTLPVDGLTHLRWIRLESGNDVVFFRGLDAPDAALDVDVVLTSFAPAAVSRYRIGLASGFSQAEDASRFGWSSEPLVTVPVPGTGRAAIASYGSMILVDQSGIAIADLRTARDGDGVVAILQELQGAARDITLGFGLLSFTGGRRIDFLERDLGPLPGLGGRGVSVPVAGHGITAVRLTGIGLAGG